MFHPQENPKTTKLSFFNKQWVFLLKNDHDLGCSFFWGKPTILGNTIGPPRLLDLRLTRRLFCRRVLREFLDFGLAGLQLAWWKHGKVGEDLRTENPQSFDPLGDFFGKKKHGNVGETRETGGEKARCLFFRNKKFSKVEVVEVDKDF